MATKTKTVQVVLDLPPQLASAIDRYAQKEGRRFKQLCIDAIRYRVRMLADKHKTAAKPAVLSEPQSVTNCGGTSEN